MKLLELGGHGVKAGKSVYESLKARIQANVNNKNHASCQQPKKPIKVQSTGPWEALSAKSILEPYHISSLLLQIHLLRRH